MIVEFDALDVGAAVAVAHVVGRVHAIVVQDDVLRVLPPQADPSALSGRDAGQEVLGAVRVSDDKVPSVAGV